MASDKAVKGLALENAIEKIEGAILRSDPTLKGGIFKIETRKIIVSSGVKHEIDVYVSIDHIKGYNSVFIFEAKNWKEKVGKNEIIIFQEKIKAISAQKGFFVSKEFTKDAVNQAELEPRMELVVASESFEMQPLFPDVHVLVREQAESRMSVTFTAQKSQPKKDLQIIPIKSDDIVTVDGKEQTFKEFANYLFENTAAEKFQTVPTQTYLEGKYTVEHKKIFDFLETPVIYQEKTFESIETDAIIAFKIVRPKVVSRFDIKSRGRVVTLETVELGGGNKIDLSLIAH